MGKYSHPEQVENFLKQNKKSNHWPLSTVKQAQVLNPIKEIADVANKMGVLFAVDAVSSVGVVRIDMDNWGIDFCVTASQKGLGTPPGRQY